MADSIRRLQYFTCLHRQTPRRNYFTITNLPKEVLFNILLRLSTKTLFRCRCVCKILRNTISDKDFGKLHFKKSADSMEIVVRPDSPGSFSRTLYLLDLDRLKPYAELVLPLNNEIAYFGFDIINSCNGLVCLCRSIDKNPILVCNPITGEYIKIPTNPKNRVANLTKKKKKELITRCNPIQCGCSLCLDYVKIESAEVLLASGFGFSPKTNQYKVIRIFNPRPYSSRGAGLGLEYYMRSAEIYILGKGYWRRTEIPPQIPHLLLFPTYLKEKIYWVCALKDKFDVIIYFDFDYEHFKVVSSPPCFGVQGKDINHLRMQELGGWLCVCDFSSFKCYDIWLMKDFAGKKLWNKAYAIHMRCGKFIEPIKFLNDEEILMINGESKTTLVSYNCLSKEFREYKIRGIQSHFEAFIHIPNFCSLKDIVKGDNQRRR